jgi:hypothetical protein
VGHLAKVYGHIPYAATADFFNREASTLAKDIRAFEATLLKSPQERKRLELLTIKLIESNTPSIHA